MMDDPFDDAVRAFSRTGWACGLDGLVRALRRLATSLASHQHAAVLQSALP